MPDRADQAMVYLMCESYTISLASYNNRPDMKDDLTPVRLNSCRHSCTITFSSMKIQIALIMILWIAILIFRCGNKDYRKPVNLKNVTVPGNTDVKGGQHGIVSTV